MSRVDKLINKKLNKATHELDHTILLSDSVETIDLHLQLFFDDYILNVYNLHKLFNVDKVDQLVGCKSLDNFLKKE